MEGIRRALVLVLIAGTAIEQAPFVGLKDVPYLHLHINNNEISHVKHERSSVCQLCQKQHDLGSETRPLLVDVGLKCERAEMQMIRWMCVISVKDKRTNEELRRLVGVEPITTVIKSGRLRGYGHVMRKSDEEWMKKCMEFRVEGRKPVGRPRRTYGNSL